MAALVLLSIVACLLVGNMGKIFRRCELAQVLHQAGMDGFRGYSLADWLCMAFHESRFNTDTVDHEADGSTDNGIFQINSRQWCDDYKRSARNLCHMHCSDLLTSNINDDIVCAMQIVQQPRGMGACCWPGGNTVRAMTSHSGWKDAMWEVDEGAPLDALDPLDAVYCSHIRPLQI
ncbi:unnamed protein product [Lepidochelys kempii]